MSEHWLVMEKRAVLRQAEMAHGETSVEAGAARADLNRVLKTMGKPEVLPPLEAARLDPYLFRRPEPEFLRLWQGEWSNRREAEGAD